MKTLLLAVAAIAVVGVTMAAETEGPSLPDPQLTSFTVVTSSLDTIREPGYDKAHRVWRDKASTMAKYGLADAPYRDYEDDDLVPVCLGGNNADPRNHWPQPIGEAQVKDKVEDHVCAAVKADPNADDARLLWWQQWFAKGGWVKLVDDRDTDFPPGW